MMSIVLISDFGNCDQYIPIAKGILRTKVPDAQLLDNTHCLEPNNYVQAAYLLRSSYPYYPQGTIHLSFFDCMRYFPCAVMACEVDGHYFLGSDTGHFTSTFDEKKTQFFIGHQVAVNFTEFVAFAADLIQIIRQEGLSSQHFLPYSPLRIFRFPQPKIMDNSIECLVIYIDHHSNVITNLQRDTYEAARLGREVRVRYDRYEELECIYDSMEPSAAGRVHAYFNINGYLQISMKDKRANTAKLTGLSVYQEGALRNTFITIRFL